MTVRVSVLDLVHRTAVVRVVDDGREELPHILRGALAAMLADPSWHVVVAFEAPGTPRDDVEEVLDQARRWAAERQCRLSVTTTRDLAALRGTVT